jgi:hypothetical protein
LFYGSNKYSQWVFSSHEVDELEGLLDNEAGLQFFTGISSMEHHGINQSFDNWALGLSEFQNLISTSSVWDEYL